MATKKNPERHSRACSICRSPFRAEIEESYLRWESPSAICRQFKIRSRNSLNLHSRALNLTTERDKTIKRCLSTIIEKNLGKKLSGAALIAAIALFARIDADGRAAERVETSPAPGRFDLWTRGELAEFVSTGKRPERFEQQV
jgi:hypothetical protein